MSYLSSQFFPTHPNPSIRTHEEGLKILGFIVFLVYVYTYCFRSCRIWHVRLNTSWIIGFEKSYELYVYLFI